MYVYRYVIFLILFFLLFKMIFIRRLPHQKKQVSVASDHFISIKIHVIFQILLAKMIYFCRNLFKNPSATNHNCLCHSLCRWNCMHAQMRRKSHCKAHSCICVYGFRIFHQRWEIYSFFVSTTTNSFLCGTNVLELLQIWINTHTYSKKRKYFICQLFSCIWFYYIRCLV